MEKVMEFNDKTTKQIAATALQLLNGVTTLANTRGISREELEAVYQVGFSFYNTGKFDEAEKIFTFLSLMSHTTGKYWTALGAVRQVKKNYGEAIKAYATAALLDLEQPKPHYYAAECAFLSGDLDTAESGCRTLLHYCTEKPGASNREYRALAEKLLKQVLEAREAAEKKA